MTTKFALIVRIIVAVVLVQTLTYKFTADPDSVYIFSKVGLEPYGRIGIGILELIAAFLILIKKTTWVGAIMSVGIIGGALLMHVTVLGIEINGDNGKLFYMAVLVFALSIFIIWTEKKQIPFIKDLF